MFELSETFKASLYRDHSGRIPANIFNTYSLLRAHEYEFGAFSKLNGKIICIRAGNACRKAGKQVGQIEYSRIKAFVFFLFGCEPTIDTIKRVLCMLAEDYLLLCED